MIRTTIWSGQHPRAAGDRGTVAARLADDGGRLAGDRRLVDAGDALDDTSPSLGITSPALTTHSSPTSSAVLARSSIVAVGSRGACHRLGAGLAQRVGLRLASPSAIASAKFANSTVNQRNSATRPVKTFWSVDDEPRSLKNRTVVSTEPTPTTNITGLRISVRGFSLTKLSTTARRTRSRSTSLVSRGIGAPPSDLELLDDGTEREGGQERRAAATITTTPITSTTNSGVSVGNVPADGGTCCLRTTEPARASVGMIRKKRPNSMAMPSVVFIHARVRGDPANAEPLLFAADVNAYSSSLKPCAPGLKIETLSTDSDERRTGDEEHDQGRHDQDVDRDELHLGGLDLLAQVLRVFARP